MNGLFYSLIGSFLCGVAVWLWQRYFHTKKRSVIIVLIGASSSGKTSVARELINMQYPKRLFLTTGIDQTFFALGSATNIVTKKHWVNGAVNFSYVTDIDGSPVVDLHMGSLGDKIQRINFDFGIAAANGGLHVIVDEVLLNDETFEYLLKSSSEHDVYLVNMYAPLMIREERERMRGNRFIGHTRSQELRAYSYKGHDLFREKLCDLAFETHINDARECASMISEYIDNNKPSAIFKMCTLQEADGVENTANYKEARDVEKYPFVGEKKPVAFLLIGASSAGKTTLSKAIIDSFYPEKIFLSAGIDDIFRALGDETTPLRRDYWVDGEINYLHGYDEHGKPTVAVSLGALGENLMCLAYDRAIAFLDAGFNVVIDDVLLSDRVFEYALEKLKNYEVYLIGVHAPLEVRETRESIRGNRPIGHTRTQEHAAYSFKGVNLLKEKMFDLDIDTSVSDVQSSVAQLKELMALGSGQWKKKGNWA